MKGQEIQVFSLLRTGQKQPKEIERLSDVRISRRTRKGENNPRHREDVKEQGYRAPRIVMRLFCTEPVSGKISLDGAYIIDWIGLRSPVPARPSV